MPPTNSASPPAVSLVVPCKGRIPLLEQTLESARRQTFRDFECIVVDDEPSAASRRAAQSLGGGDERFRYLAREGEPSGGNACRNQGLRASRGEFVVFLDSDDILFDDCLERRVAEARGGEKLDARIYQAVKIFGSELSRELFNYDLPDADDVARFACLDWPWQTTAAMLTRSYLVERGIAWDEAMNTAQDVDFFLQLLLSGARVAKIKRCDYGYRLAHSDDSVGQNPFSQRKIGSYLRLIEKLAASPQAIVATPARRQAVGNLCYSVFLALRSSDDAKQARRVLTLMRAFGARNRLASQILAANLRTRRGGYLHFKTLKLFQVAFSNSYKTVPTHDHAKPEAQARGYEISPAAWLASSTSGSETKE